MRSLLFIPLVLVALVGCGSGANSGSDGAPAAPTTSVPVPQASPQAPAGTSAESPPVSEPATSTGAGPAGTEPPSASSTEPSAVPSPASDAAGDRVVAGYLPSWGVYDRDYGADDVPAERLTHLNYAFANVSANGEVVLGDAWADTQLPFPGDSATQTLKGNFNQLLRLKARYPHLKTLISVGGWTWSGRFSDAALTEASRARFARSAVRFVVQYGFDGVDIDWEYPVAGGLDGGRPEDRHNFTLLMAELRRQLDARGALEGRRYLLTAAIGAGRDKTANLEVGALSAIVDWFNLMTYDFHGAWEGTTGHHAALHPSATDPALGLGYTVEDAVASLMAAGAPADRIVVGVPFYGRAWQQVPATNGGLFQRGSTVAPPGSGESGSSGSGINDFRELLAFIQSGDYTRHWDAEAGVPWLYASSRLGGHFISYEDRQSLALKVDYVRARGLRGMMCWELSADASTPADSLLSVMADGLR